MSEIKIYKAGNRFVVNKKTQEAFKVEEFWTEVLNNKSISMCKLDNGVTTDIANDTFTWYIELATAEQYTAIFKKYKNVPYSNNQKYLYIINTVENQIKENTIKTKLKQLKDAQYLVKTLKSDLGIE